jgi:hypothetical protein
MLWTALAESTHSHPKQTDSSSCSICIVAHSTTPAPSSNHAKPLFVTVDLLHEPELVAQSHLNVIDLGIRGPPVA